MTNWDECEHEWIESKSETAWDCTPPQCTPMVCVKCGVLGEKTNKTGDVYWPCT